MENVVERLTELATVYGLKVIGAILILIIGRIAAGIMRKVVRKILTRTNTDKSIVSFAGSLVYALVIVFVIIAVLQKFGVETASLVAVLGAATFAIGFALQGSLSNFAAGVMILLFRPYKIGDFIDAAGVAGSVKEIKLFTTILATPDNIKIIVPNSKIFGDTIKNITAYDTRKINLEVGIGYDSSIKKAIEVLEKLIKEDTRILSEPAHQIAVAALADSSVNLVVRPWVKKEDYWSVYFDLTRKIKEAFDENSIEIPFPQRVVHMASEGAK
ncbi:MAG: mechanosensitive ion channel protein [candidate division Zixibacteria bacterium SM23_81]|nr:MAG: mechanosensitive ion channel protein [candidate division Zixibacteria bacterium SM23_81]